MCAKMTLSLPLTLLLIVQRELSHESAPFSERRSALFAVRLCHYVPGASTPATRVLSSLVRASTKCAFAALCVSSQLCFIVWRFGEGLPADATGVPARHAPRPFATLARSKTPFSVKYLNLEDERAQPSFFFTFFSSGASDGQPSGSPLS